MTVKSSNIPDNALKQLRCKDDGKDDVPEVLSFLAAVVSKLLVIAVITNNVIAKLKLGAIVSQSATVCNGAE